MTGVVSVLEYGEPCQDVSDCGDSDKWKCDYLNNYDYMYMYMYDYYYGNRCQCADHYSYNGTDCVKGMFV